MSTYTCHWDSLLLISFFCNGESPYQYPEEMMSLAPDYWVKSTFELI